MLSEREQQTGGGENLYFQLFSGVFLSLLICAAGVASLAWAMSRGLIFSDGISFPVLASLSCAAAFAGALRTLPRRPRGTARNYGGNRNRGGNAKRDNIWGVFSRTMTVSGCFALCLILIALSLFHRIAWNGHGGGITLGILSGGVLAGLIGSSSGTGKKRGNIGVKNIRRR